MVQYYMKMWTIWFHILATQKELDTGTKGVKIIWNNEIELDLKNTE